MRGQRRQSERRRRCNPARFLKGWTVIPRARKAASSLSVSVVLPVPEAGADMSNPLIIWQHPESEGLCQRGGSGDRNHWRKGGFRQNHLRRWKGLQESGRCIPFLRPCHWASSILVSSVTALITSRVPLGTALTSAVISASFAPPPMSTASGGGSLCKWVSVTVLSIKVI